MTASFFFMSAAGSPSPPAVAVADGLPLSGEGAGTEEDIIDRWGSPAAAAAAADSSCDLLRAMATEGDGERLIPAGAGEGGDGEEEGRD